MKTFLQGEVLTAADLNANFAEGTVNTDAQYTFTNVISFSNSISANGSNGTAGQVLTTSGTKAYWATVSGGGSTNVAAQYTWTNTHTFSNGVTLSSTITANSSTGTSGQVLSSSGTGVYWQTVTGVNTAAQYTFSNTITFNGPIASANTISANGSVGSAGYLLTSGGASKNAYWSDISSTYVNTSQLSSNLASYVNTSQLSSNLTNYATTTSLSSYVTSSQLSSNLSNYALTTSGTTTFAGNVSITSNLSVSGTIVLGSATINSTSYTGAANNASYLGGTTASGYQTTAGLSANVATLTANAAGYLGTQLPAYYTNATNITTGTLPYGQLGSAVVNTSGSFTLAGNTTLSGTNTVINSNTFLTAAVTVNNSLSMVNYNETVYTGGTISVNANNILLANGNIQTFTLANATITFTINTTSITSGKSFPLTLILTQDATGGRLITWGNVSQTVKWAGGSAPTLSTGASNTDIITLFTINGGTVWYGALVGKGF